MMVKIIRYMMALCFILSGILKMKGIKAFEQEVQLYGDAYVGTWVHDNALGIAVLICTMEVTLGFLSMNHRWRLPTALLFVAMLSTFVYLTGMNLFFPTMMGSIESCGCFGELIHFTPVSSFVKSTILLGLSLGMLYADTIDKVVKEKRCKKYSNKRIYRENS